MALKQIMLAKKISRRKEELSELNNQSESMRTREAELVEALDEASTDEEIAAVEEQVASLEGDKDEIDVKRRKLLQEIKELEEELSALDDSAPKTGESSTTKNERDGGFVRMERRYKNNMTPEQRDAYLRRNDVKEFYERVRGFISEKRTVGGAELVIPDVTLDLLRDNLDGYSKLIKYVYLKPVKGTSRQTIVGEIPEGIWMEMKGVLDKLSFDFSQFELDGYKVGGFIPIHNSTINDSYVNLAGEIEYMISEAIGYALDKAIVYGKGKGDSMPLGFVTGLVNNSLASNIIKIDGLTKTGVKLFKEILCGVGQTKSNKARNPITFLMNQQTWSTLIMPESLNVNSAGALVAAANNTFPVLGGNIEFLDFIPYGDIVGGYLEKYLLVEREGATLARSEHAMFIQDQTVFRGVARYDGTPVRPAAFFAINIQNKEPATSISFAAGSDEEEPGEGA